MELHYRICSTCLRPPPPKEKQLIFFLLFKNPKLFACLMQFITQSYKTTSFILRFRRVQSIPDQENKKFKNYLY